MDSARVLQNIDDLDDSLAVLQEALEPLLNSSLHAASRKLPLLDRAKLNVTVVYAIESLLFSCLRVNGVDAKEHAVFKELSRVRSYFDKLKEADDKQKNLKPTRVIDKAASNRIILHDLGAQQRRKDKLEEAAQKMKALKEKILAKRKSVSAPQTPAPAPSSPHDHRNSLDPSELLESISKEIEMHVEEQEGSEEGEIEESPSALPPLPEYPAQLPPQAHVQSKKRKHDHVQNGKTSTNDQRSNKKNRKRAKNKNLH